MRPCPLVTVLFLVAGCDQSVVQYTTTDEVRAALAPADIGCKDYVVEPPVPVSIACSFSEWIPQRGLRGGAVVMFADPEEAAGAAKRCRKGKHDDGGQILYREGQAWVATIAAYAPDHKTASNIEDQAFVARVAELLGTDVIDC
jgi:hypothetical protein